MAEMRGGRTVPAVPVVVIVFIWGVPIVSVASCFHHWLTMNYAQYSIECSPRRFGNKAHDDVSNVALRSIIYFEVEYVPH